MSVTDGAASRTAQMVASYRAQASARPEPLIGDPWAADLAGEVGREVARRASELNPFMELWIAVRTAFLDQQVRQRTPACSQVVLLGAGLDTRAARLATSGVRFFEVDHPESQALKRERLAGLSGYPVDAATYVGCDFERDDFLERLGANGFQKAAPALFLWEGVVMYLTEEAVRATLDRIAACHAESVVLFDYVNKNMVEGRKLRAEDAETRALIHELGEPFRFGLNDPVPLLFQAGFRQIRCHAFDELCLSLTGTYERERLFRFQGIAVASREHPLEPGCPISLPPAS